MIRKLRLAILVHNSLVVKSARTVDPCLKAGTNIAELPDIESAAHRVLVEQLKRVLENAEKECADKLQPVDEKKTAKENRRKELYDARSGKKDDEIPQSEKDELFEIEKEITAAKSEKEAILAQYAAGDNTVKQLIDITLLQNNMLTGEALNNFVKRSIELMK